jgi:hypothetical protein
MKIAPAFSHSRGGVQVTSAPPTPGMADQVIVHENPDLDRFSEPDLDDYRIALIPPRTEIGRREVTSRMLVLSLTWKQLRMRPGREAGHPPNRMSACFGEIHIDFDGMEVLRSNRPVSLTAMEFKVLKFFVLNPRRAISRDALLNQVWGYNNYPYSRTVDNHIMRLRQKLEADGSRPVHFQTVHGVGYKFIP